MTYALTARTRQHARKFPDPPYCVDPNSVQAQGLTLWLPMDPRGGGTVFDRSGYGRLGTLTNGPTWGYDEYGNGALSFDGSDDYVNVPNSSFPVPPGHMTLSCRFRASVSSGLCGWNANAAGSDAATYDRILHADASGNLTWHVFDGSARTATSSGTNYTDGNWRQAAGVIDGGPSKLYVDGVQRGSAGTNVNNGFNGYTPTLILGRAAGTKFLTGDLADVRVYTVGLPAALVYDVYDRPAALAYPLRRRVWSFPRGNRRRRVLLTGGG